MSGQIGASAPGPWPDSKINLASLDKLLTVAFKAPDCAAVAIEMNSPGGSPAQSALLHNRLVALRKQHPGVPVICFCTDVCASGGYYIASACDEIHCLPSSLVGSIGVVSPGLGLTGLMKMYGVEDRTMTSGTSKGGDNPLAPRDPIAVAKKRALLDELHEDFKAAVSSARGGKLKHAEAAAYARKCGDKKGWRERQQALFDGSVYTGRRAVDFGLADELYETMGASLRQRFGDDVKIREYKAKVGVLDKLGALQQAGTDAALARDLGSELESGLARLASAPEQSRKLLPTLR